MRLDQSEDLFIFFCKLNVGFRLHEVSVPQANSEFISVP